MSTQVPAAPARIHVQNLLVEGMTQAAICRAANVTSSYLSALLYGQYTPGRPPQETTDARTADRLLAVRYDPSAPKESKLCSPGDRFTPVGYRVGQCDDCGQWAPVHNREGIPVMMGHPRGQDGAQETEQAPPAPVRAHPDCGTPKGFQRHRREKTDYCEPCRAARHAYDQGYDAGMTKARRSAVGAVPAPLADAAVKAMRAVLYRRPYPQLRELAAAVVRIADAELAADAAPGQEVADAA